jgi:hypothetical protein
MSYIKVINKVCHIQTTKIMYLPPNPKQGSRLTLFIFMFLNLFKSWSNLGFDEDSNGRKNT